MLMVAKFSYPFPYLQVPQGNVMTIAAKSLAKQLMDTHRLLGKMKLN